MTNTTKRWMFLDMNAFFASVEQQERPELRGKAVIVCPLEAETTCAIAASYEAKRYGIKTGTKVSEARRIAWREGFPLAVVPARPRLYAEKHRQIVAALEALFVEVRVLSVDEMACGVSRLDTGPEGEARLAARVKAQLRQDVGEVCTCSIGFAPNVFLAKVAADFVKPDGLTIFRQENLRQSLFRLELMDLPGIGARMLARLEVAGIRTVRQLCEADPVTLRRAWGGVVGERWYWMLRGSTQADYGMHHDAPRRQVGHSHVLPPEYRSRAGAQAILMRLFSKALKRLRVYGMKASSVTVWADLRREETREGGGWTRESRRHAHASDELSWMSVVRPMVEALPEPEPGFRWRQVGIVFGGLQAEADVNLSLFEEPGARDNLARTVDALNAKREGAVDVASVFWLREEAPYRLPFGKPMPCPSSAVRLQSREGSHPLPALPIRGKGEPMRAPSGPEAGARQRNHVSI